MSTLVQLIQAELFKLRRSPALRLMWVMPCLFLLLDFILSGRFALGLKEVGPEARAALLNAPVKSLADYWSGYFHPMLIALLPALLFRPEHRYGVWKHLHVQPVSRRLLYLVKALVLALAFALVLALTEVLLWAQWGLLGRLSPLAAFPFPWLKVSLVMGWSFLGSLPLLALYLWLSDRINNAAVPVMLGLVGFILTVSMGGKELDPMWRRDFIPWVLPYTCAQQAIEDPSARQEIHAAQSGLEACQLGLAPALLMQSLPDGLQGDPHVADAQELADELGFPLQVMHHAKQGQHIVEGHFGLPGPQRNQSAEGEDPGPLAQAQKCRDLVVVDAHEAAVGT